MLNYVKTSKSAAPHSSGPTKDAERSPQKKKFKETSTSISREELECAILAGVKQALAEQRAELNTIVTTAVRSALDDVLLPQITDLRLELKNTNDTVTSATDQIEQLEMSVKRVQSRCDSTQSAARQDRDQVAAMRMTIDELHSKLAEMEDRSRRNNLRLVGLSEGAEGDHCISFLKESLPKWIPALMGQDIKIERAHRVYADRSNNNRPRTVIFKLLDFNDRQAILNGARAVPSVMHGSDTIRFFPDYSAETTKKRKAFTDVRKRIESFGIETFLLYPATLKITHRGGGHTHCQSPAEAEQFLLSNNLAYRRPASANATPRGRRDDRQAASANNTPRGRIYDRQAASAIATPRERLDAPADVESSEMDRVETELEMDTVEQPTHTASSPTEAECV